MSKNYAVVLTVCVLTRSIRSPYGLKYLITMIPPPITIGLNMTKVPGTFPFDGSVPAAGRTRVGNGLQTVAKAGNLAPQGEILTSKDYSHSKNNRKNKNKNKALEKENRKLREQNEKLKLKLQKLSSFAGRTRKEHKRQEGKFCSKIDVDPEGSIIVAPQGGDSLIGKIFRADPVQDQRLYEEFSVTTSYMMKLREMSGDSYDLSALFLKVAAYLVAIYEANNVNQFSRITLGVLAQYIDANALLYFKSKWDDIVSPEGFDLTDLKAKVAGVKGLMTSIEDTPCYKIIQQGLALLVFSGLRPSGFLIEESTLHTIVSTAEERVKGTPFDAVLLMLSFSETVIEIFDVYSRGGSIRHMLLPSTIHERVAYARSRELSVLQGTYAKLYNRDPVEFERDVQNVIRDLNFELRRKDIVPSLKPIYGQYLTLMMKIQYNLDVKNNSVRMREAPQTAMIYGTSSVGKTTVMEELIYRYGQEFNVDVSDDRRWALNERDAFDSQMKQDANVITADDLGNMPVDKMSPRETGVARTIDIVNNATKFSVQAIAEDKGKIQFQPKLVVGTTNVKHLNAQQVSMEPFSILRRWLFIQVRVKTRYAMDDEPARLDTRKAESFDGDIQPPIHEARVFRWELRDSRLIEKYITDWACVSEIYPVVIDIWREEKKHQTSFVERSLATRPAYCKLCTNPDNVDWCLCRKSFPMGLENHLKDDLNSGRRQLRFKNWISPAVEAKLPTPELLTFHEKCELHGLYKVSREIVGSIVSGDEVDAYMNEFMPDTSGFTPQASLILDLIAHDGLRRVWNVIATLPPLPNLEGFGTHLLFFTVKGVQEFHKRSPFVWLIRSLIIWSIILVDWLEGLHVFDFGLHSSVYFCILFFMLYIFRLAYSNIDFTFWFIILSIYGMISLFALISMVIPSGMVFGVMASILALGVYSGLNRFARLSIYRMIVDTEHGAYRKLYDGVLTGAYLIATIAMVRSFWVTYQRVTAEGNLIPSSKKDVEDRHSEKNDWLIPEIVRMDAPKEVRSMTIEQVCAKLKQNILRFELCTNLVPRARGVALMVRPNVMMIPKHIWSLFSDNIEDMTFNLERTPGCLTAKTRGAVVENHHNIDNNDFTLVVLSKSFTVSDIVPFLPETFPSVETAGKLLLKRIDTYSEIDCIFQPVTSVDNMRHRGRGGQYFVDGGTQKGDCCSPFVSRTNPHLIYSFHCGGEESTGKGAGFTILRKDMLAALDALTVLIPEGDEVLPSKISFPYSFVGLNDVSPLDGEPCFSMTDEIHERSVVNFVKDEADLPVPHCEVAGYNPNFRTTPHSQVRITPISEFLERAGWQRVHGRPEFRSDRNHAEYFQQGVRGMESIRHSVLCMSMNDYVAGLFPAFRRVEFGGAVPLSIFDALNGVEGNRWIKPLRDKTSPGFGLNKKKTDYLKIYYLDNGRKLFELDSRLIKSTQDALSQLRRGELLSPLVKTALKDEPTKLPQFNEGKSKVRVFAVFPFVHFLVGKMLFAPLLAALYDIPLESELLQGTNVTTSDWEQVYQRLIAFKPDQVLEGDFKKYDIKLSGQLIRSVGKVFAALASYSGYSTEDIKAVYTYVCDIAQNPWLYNGTVFVVDSWNPSGNYLTIAINGIANCLLHRCAYFDRMRGAGTFIAPFRDMVHLGTVGDDSLASSRLTWFNMEYLRHYFDRHNLTYTFGSKAAVETPFIDGDHATLCKRGFRYESRVGEHVAPLSLDSIGKMIHCFKLSVTDDFTIVRGNLLVALRELARHDFNVFEEHRKKIQLALEYGQLEYLCPEVNRTYDEWWDILIQDFPDDPTYHLGAEEDDDQFDDPTSVSAITFEPHGDFESHDEFKERFIASVRARTSLPSNIPVKQSRNSSGYRRGRLRSAATLGFTIFSLVLFTCGQLYPLLRKHIKIWISNDNTKETVQSESMARNVFEFMDETAMWGSSFPYTPEETIGQGMQHYSNDSVLLRPVNILDFTWTVGVPLNVTINPWSSFLLDARVANRIAHYKYFRGNLRLTFMLNGNPFYFGRMLCSYVPMHTSDFVSDFNSAAVPALRLQSQRPHILLDPADNQGGDLVLPFIWPFNAAEVVSSYSDLGLLQLCTLNPLQNVMGASSPVSITVLARFEPGYTLSMPTTQVLTQVSPQGNCLSNECEIESEVSELSLEAVFKPVEPQGDEYGKVSGPAHTVASWTGKLANAPIIGQYARATQFAAEAIRDIAQLFGYSRPRELSCNPMAPRVTINLANTNAPDISRSLAMDQKKEITIDPAAVGCSREDPMALVPLAMRESLVTQFPWSPNDQQSQFLFNIRVTPLQGSFNAQSRICATPSAWVALPFTYWTGSMEFRFQVVCSKFHRGRLRIRWDPSHIDGTNEGVLKFNTTFTKIVDISEETDFTMKVNWGQKSNYLRVHNPRGATSEFPSYASNSEGVRFPNSEDFRCNGIIDVDVLNRLTTPQGSSTPIFINVYAKMCDDFEVIQPSSEFVQRLTDVNAYSPGPLPSLATLSNTPPNVAAPSQPIPPPVPANIVTKTLKPNGVVLPRIGLNTPEISTPEWSTTIGVTTANKAEQLWNSTTLAQYHLVAYGSSSVGPFKFRFENPSATASVITLDFTEFGGTVVTGTLAASIGATLELTVPIINRASTGLVPFKASNTAVRPLLDEVETQLPVDYDVGVIENTDWNSLEGTGSFSIVSGALSYSGAVRFKAPGDWVIGTRMMPVSAYTLDVGEGGNADRVRVRTSPPVTNGMVMGSYSPNVLYTSTSNVMPGAIVFRAFDVAGAPETRTIERMFYIKDTTKSKFPAQIVGTSVFPQGDVIGENDMADKNCPVGCPPDMEVGDSAPGLGVNTIYFGEQVGSWRTALKRYVNIATCTYANSAVSFYRFPTIPYKTFTQGTVASGSLGMVTRPGTLLHLFVSRAYVTVRGGMRYSVVSPGTPTNALNGVSISLQTLSSFPGPSVSGAPSTALEPTWAGTALDSIAMSPCNVEIPYYSNLRFIPARASVDNSAYVKRGGFDVTSAIGNDRVVFVVGSIAEDYSLAFFLSVPEFTWADPPPP